MESFLALLPLDRITPPGLCSPSTLLLTYLLLTHSYVLQHACMIIELTLGFLVKQQDPQELGGLFACWFYSHVFYSSFSLQGLEKCPAKGRRSYQFHEMENNRELQVMNQTMFSHFFPSTYSIHLKVSNKETEQARLIPQASLVFAVVVHCGMRRFRSEGCADAKSCLCHR